MPPDETGAVVPASPDVSLPGVSPKRWKLDARALLRQHTELLFVVGILISLVAVFHWIPETQKLAFLNFFYLPVLAGGYLLGARRAMLMSVLCVLAVVLYYLWAWTKDALMNFQSVAALAQILFQNWATLLSLAMWGGFLILIGGAFARVHERMQQSYARSQLLNQQLQGQTEELTAVNQALEASSAELKQHTDQLQEKNLLIEQLKQQAEQTLYSTMDATVARLVIQGRLRQEKRAITALFCDLKGFTSYSQSRHPEVILEDLNHFYGAMEEVIETYHGHIDKYMGDGIMCEFGAPVDYEQHSLHAVVAALKMQEKVHELKLPWQLRVGAASGEAIVGLLGRRRRSYSALGDIVNLAKRLEELCEPESIYVDEKTYEAVRPFVEVQQVRSLRGRRSEDSDVSAKIVELEKQLRADPQNPDLLFGIGQLYFQLHEATRALNFFHRAMELAPENNEFKVAYADASVKRDEYEKISIRGLEEKRAVFKITGLVDPLRDRERFPEHFYQRYEKVPQLMEVPEHAVLPSEVIDATVGHSLAVAVICYAIADHRGLSDELKRDLLIAGRLQDVGKSIIWHHIINRRGGLSDQERKDLEAHVTESISISKRMGFGWPGVLEIIANHHELLNGSGYPRRLKEDEIPMGARISGVADVYCALTAWRPYRDAWDSRVALSEIRKGAAAGKFDPHVVDALGELLSP